MESDTQIKREQLRELLTNRIQSGEALRRELAEIFNESARSLLTPAAQDIRAAGATALSQLAEWKTSLEATMRDFDSTNRNSLSEHDRSIREAWRNLEADVSTRLKDTSAALEKASSLWSKRCEATDREVRECVSRLEPVSGQIRDAADSLHTTVAAATSEAGALLREISEQAKEDAIASGELKSSVSALLREFQERHAAAQAKFAELSQELLRLQQDRSVETSRALADLRKELEELTAANAAEIRQLSKSLRDAAADVGKTIRTAIGEMQKHTDAETKQLREKIEAGNSALLL